MWKKYGIQHDHLAKSDKGNRIICKKTKYISVSNAKTDESNNNNLVVLIEKIGNSEG